MDHPEIRNKLDAFISRMAIKLDTLGRYERDHKEVFSICMKALRKKYEIVVDYNEKLIQIGERIDGK